jgi:hypothetical protein
MAEKFFRYGAGGYKKGSLFMLDDCACPHRNSSVIASLLPFGAAVNGKKLWAKKDRKSNGWVDHQGRMKRGCAVKTKQSPSSGGAIFPVYGRDRHLLQFSGFS